VARFAAIRDLPAVTKDGVRITLNMNAGLMVDLPHLAECGADGIGLFRTELQFLIGTTMPRLKDQIAFYADVYDAAGKRPVVFRTLDLGGDKVPSYGRHEREENPALGWRALRVALDRPALLRYQARALIAAAQGRPLRILLPMVSDVSEFQMARDVIGREMTRAKKVGVALPKTLEVGAMIEVPSLLFQLDQMVSVADFLSVGSNDLLQFVFAADRTNPIVARRYDSLSPAVLRMVRMIAKAGEARPNHISFCGEMAGQPLEALALVGLGITSLSMHAANVGPVKEMVRVLDLGELRPFMENLCASTASGARRQLAEYAAAHAIPIEGRS
jgi:phosphotransferase system enzyme I (PtsP)